MGPIDPLNSWQFFFSYTLLVAPNFSFLLHYASCKSFSPGLWRRVSNCSPHKNGQSLEPSYLPSQGLFQFSGLSHPYKEGRKPSKGKLVFTLWKAAERLSFRCQEVLNKKHLVSLCFKCYFYDASGGNCAVPEVLEGGGWFSQWLRPSLLH